MATTAKKEAARQSVSSAPLTNHYRAIGVSSVAAALLFMRKGKASGKSA